MTVMTLTGNIGREFPEKSRLKSMPGCSNLAISVSAPARLF